MLAARKSHCRLAVTRKLRRRFLMFAVGEGTSSHDTLNQGDSRWRRAGAVRSAPLAVYYPALIPDANGQNAAARGVQIARGRPIVPINQWTQASFRPLTFASCIGEHQACRWQQVGGGRTKSMLPGKTQRVWGTGVYSRVKNRNLLRISLLRNNIITTGFDNFYSPTITCSWIKGYQNYNKTK